jgi:hemolysin activation/secretion protein
MDKIGEYESRIVAGWEVKAYKNSVVLFGEDFGKDVTVRPFSLGYSGTLPVASGNVNFSVTAVRNIPGGSNGKQADIAAARPGAAAIGPTPATPTLPADPGWPAVDAARADFSILRVSGAFNYPVGSWQFRTLMNAQMTSDALVPGEQFGAGGASSVRGFDERALATDTGVLANIEAFSPNFCGKSRWSCRMVFFYDTAHGRINDPHRYQPATNTISSTGLGVRLAMGDMVNLQVDYGHVLRLGSTGVIDKNKLHFRLGFAY